MRTVLLVTALGFIGIFAFLTIDAAIRSGPDILTVFSIIVLAMFSFGIVGALRQPPEE